MSKGFVSVPVRVSKPIAASSAEGKLYVWGLKPFEWVSLRCIL